MEGRPILFLLPSLGSLPWGPRPAPECFSNLCLYPRGGWSTTANFFRSSRYILGSGPPDEQLHNTARWRELFVWGGLTVVPPLPGHVWWCAEGSTASSLQHFKACPDECWEKVTFLPQIQSHLSYQDIKKMDGGVRVSRAHTQVTFQ